MPRRIRPGHANGYDGKDRTRALAGDDDHDRLLAALRSGSSPRALHCSKLLCHQPEPDDGKVMIERVCEPNSRALHDRKAGGVDGGQLVQIRASKIFPRLLQIAQLAWKNPYRAGLVDGF